MDTGRKILNLRKDLGVPQKNLAHLTEVTPSALSRIEAGIHQPRGPVALRIARHLGVTVDYLLDDNAPYPPPARELLTIIEKEENTEVGTTTEELNEHEKKTLESLRTLSKERLVLLDILLDKPREDVRFAAYILGAASELPGLDSAELDRYRRRLAEHLQ